MRWIFKARGFRDPVPRQVTERVIQSSDPVIASAPSVISSDVIDTASSGVERPSGVKVATIFNRRDVAAIKYAETHSSPFLDVLTVQQRGLIRDLITRAVRDGIGVPGTAREIAQSVGLDDSQAISLATAHQDFLSQAAKQGLPITALSDETPILPDKYRIRLIRQLALMIAQTELHAAQNQVRLAGWKHAIDRGFADPLSRKRWMVGNPCHLCTEMDGETVLWDKPFSNGDDMPACHVNCKCTAVLLESGR